MALRLAIAEFHTSIFGSQPRHRSHPLNFGPKTGMKPSTGPAVSGTGPTRKGLEMAWMIWIGAALTLLGVAGLVYCVIIAVRAKKAQLPDEQMRAVLHRAVILNMAALAVSGLGLMCVVFGVMLA